MLPSNFVYQIYKEQERECMRIAEQSRMIREAEKQSGPVLQKNFQLGEWLAQRISDFTRSQRNDPSDACRAC
jgi:hypothetical protein